MGQVLRKIASLIFGIENRMDLGLEVKVVEQIFKTELDWDIDEMMSLSDENFILMLKEEKKTTDEDIGRLAEILMLAAEKMDDNPGTQAAKRNMLQKALAIHQYLENADDTFSMDRHWKIEALKKDCSE